MCFIQHFYARLLWRAVRQHLQEVSFLEENMELICSRLCRALQATREGKNLEYIGYDAKKQHVIIAFKRKEKIISVAGDSGIVMIYDILKAVWSM